MSRSKTKQKKSSAGKNIAIFLIVFVILEGLIIFGLSRLFKTEDSVVKLGGYSFYLMDSGNMGADSPKNSLVIASNGTPATDKKGYAVLCKNVGDEGTTVAWLYDIGSKGDTVDGVVYTVYQESTPDKMYDLTSDDIVGVATSYYITAGNIISFVITPFGMGICIGAPILLLIVIELIIAAAHSSRDEYDYDDDYDDDEDYYEDENGTRKRRNNQAFDDFLYGGENDEVYTTGRPKASYEEEFEDKYASMMNKNAAKQAQQEPVYTEPAYEEEPAVQDITAEQEVVQPTYTESEPVVTPAPEPEPEKVDVAPAAPAAVEASAQAEPKPGVDRSYYEKASKMIDDAVSARENKPTVQVTAQTATETSSKPENKQQTSAHRQAPRQTPQHRRPQQRKVRPRVQHQDANATLEQLMKMMEEEQKKLRDNTKSD